MSHGLSFTLNYTFSHSLDTSSTPERQDIFGGVPFPAILPLVSLRYDRVTVFSTYIPTLNGGINHGSILYVFGRIAID